MAKGQKKVSQAERKKAAKLQAARRADPSVGKPQFTAKAGPKAMKKALDRAIGEPGPSSSDQGAKYDFENDPDNWTAYQEALQEIEEAKLADQEMEEEDRFFAMSPADRARAIQDRIHREEVKALIKLKGLDGVFGYGVTEEDVAEFKNSEFGQKIMEEIAFEKEQERMLMELAAVVGSSTASSEVTEKEDESEEDAFTEKTNDKDTTDNSVSLKFSVGAYSAEEAIKDSCRHLVNHTEREDSSQEGVSSSDRRSDTQSSSCDDCSGSDEVDNLNADRGDLMASKEESSGNSTDSDTEAPSGDEDASGDAHQESVQGALSQDGGSDSNSPTTDESKRLTDDGAVYEGNIIVKESERVHTADQEPCLPEVVASLARQRPGSASEIGEASSSNDCHISNDNDNPISMVGSTDLVLSTYKTSGSPGSSSSLGSSCTSMRGRTFLFGDAPPVSAASGSLCIFVKPRSREVSREADVLKQHIEVKDKVKESPPSRRTSSLRAPSQVLSAMLLEAVRENEDSNFAPPDMHPLQTVDDFKEEFGTETGLLLAPHESPPRASSGVLSALLQEVEAENKASEPTLPALNPLATVGELKEELDLEARRTYRPPNASLRVLCGITPVKPPYRPAWLDAHHDSSIGKATALADPDWRSRKSSFDFAALLNHELADASTGAVIAPTTYDTPSINATNDSIVNDHEPSTPTPSVSKAAKFRPSKAEQKMLRLEPGSVQIKSAEQVKPATRSLPTSNKRLAGGSSLLQNRASDPQMWIGPGPRIMSVLDPRRVNPALNPRSVLASDTAKLAAIPASQLVDFSRLGNSPRMQCSEFFCAVYKLQKKPRSDTPLEQRRLIRRKPKFLKPTDLSAAIASVARKCREGNVAYPHYLTVTCICGKAYKPGWKDTARRDLGPYLTSVASVNSLVCANPQPFLVNTKLRSRPKLHPEWLADSPLQNRPGALGAQVQDAYASQDDGSATRSSLHNSAAPTATPSMRLTPPSDAGSAASGQAKIEKLPPKKAAWATIPSAVSTLHLPSPLQPHVVPLTSAPASTPLVPETQASARSCPPKVRWVLPIHRLGLTRPRRLNSSTASQQTEPLVGVSGSVEEYEGMKGPGVVKKPVCGLPIAHLEVPKGAGAHEARNIAVAQLSRPEGRAVPSLVRSALRVANTASASMARGGAAKGAPAPQNITGVSSAPVSALACRPQIPTLAAGQPLMVSLPANADLNAVMAQVQQMQSLGVVGAAVVLLGAPTLAAPQAQRSRSLWSRVRLWWRVRGGG
ncbi:hypothetical protein BJ508DRAFT_140048 [Ascobolus immersus RN42]|uniref:Uncharacterized protein n=1 Tax=Ascobolus immersus RN42 TaxID=1160509 RepID=A0A3N4I668_ASCIM|nr:hypothetical protein BJ508DRAFT_140048 [Ascobolus immersus RN42]